MARIPGDRWEERFACLKSYSGWQAIIDEIVRAVYAEDWRRCGQIERDCITICEGLGLTIGPRQCCDCGGFILLDEMVDEHDPDQCPACEKEAWQYDYQLDMNEHAEALRLGAMTFGEIETENARRRETMLYTINGVMKRDVQ